MPNDPTSFEQLLASELGNSTALDKILELLAAFGPLNAPIVGTKGADVLSPAAEGDSIFGLAGKDQLSSSLNRTLLFGGLGDDALSTNVVMPPSDAASRGLAFQSGGDGNDKLDASVTYGQTNPSAIGHGDRAVLIVQDGGAGGDTITTRAGGSSQFTTGSMDVKTFVFGGSGNDTITVTADAKGVLVGNSFVANVIDGGAGNDRITAIAETELSASIGSASNEVSGGDGNDVIDVTAIARSNLSRLASNVVDGGRGHDEIHAHNVVNTNIGATSSVMELSGGAGNDTITGDAFTRIANSVVTDSAHLDGGSGNDTLTLNVLSQGFKTSSHTLLEGGTGADTLAVRLEVLGIGGGGTSAPNVDALNVLDGGAGNDTLDAVLVVNRSSTMGAASTAINRLSGGDGSDHLTASATFTGGPTAATAIANYLDGGKGNDVLTATITQGTTGWSFLSGGDGDDVLTVVGGSEVSAGTGLPIPGMGNQLSGGRGRDTLIGGTSKDIMDGGADADRFVFAPHNGHDTIVGLTRGDKIDLTAFAAEGIHRLADLQIEQIGNNSMIHFGLPDDILVLNSPQLTANDFLFA